MRARQLTASGSQGAPGGAARFTRPRGRVRRAFTLLEAALATVIIGVGVLALIQAQATFVTTNEWSTQNATATYLCNELREGIRSMPRHDPVSGLYFDASNVMMAQARMAVFAAEVRGFVSSNAVQEQMDVRTTPSEVRCSPGCGVWFGLAQRGRGTRRPQRRRPPKARGGDGTRSAQGARWSVAGSTRSFGPARPRRACAR